MKPGFCLPAQSLTPTLLALFLALIGSGIAQPPGYDELPRTPGTGPFIPINDRPALEVSVAPGGVLALTRNDSGTTNDLDYYFGENFSQRLSILQDRPLLFNVSKLGYTSAGGTLGQGGGGGTVFTFVDDLELKLVYIDAEQTPQGGGFSMQTVTSDKEFWSSDLLVTPNGEVLVMGYFISLDRTRFQPRVFRAAPGSSPQGRFVFEEIELGLVGNYLGVVNGAPRMAFSPGVFEGNLVYFWTAQQFTADISLLVNVEIDLDNAALPGAGAAPAATVQGTNLSCGDHPTPGMNRDATGGVGFRRRPQSASVSGSTTENELVPVYAFLDFHWCLRILIPDPVGDPCPIVVCPEFISGFPYVGSYCSGNLLSGIPNCWYSVGGFLYRQRPGAGQNPGGPVPSGSETTGLVAGGGAEFDSFPVPGNSDNTGVPGDGLFFSNASAVGPAAQGAGTPVFGFRRILTDQSSIVPQIVQGQGLTAISVSNPQSFPQQVDWVFTEQDGSDFQTGSETLAANQTIEVEVESPNVGLPGSAYFHSAFGLTIQALVDLSSIVATPGFGAPGVAAASAWTMPYENPAAAGAGLGRQPAGAAVTRNTGVAIHNVENVANTCAFTAYDPAGAEAASDEREFEPGQQNALFVDQLFANLSSASGLLRIECTSPVAVVGAQQESTGAIVLTPARPE